MKFEPCDSSNLKAVCYDETTKIFAVMFKNGGQYLYVGVPKKTADEFQKAESKGSFLTQRIKPNYDVVKLEPLDESAT